MNKPTTQLRQFQVDAFTSKLFHGNPAAICPLESWLDDDLMQVIAAENNLSETAFFVPSLEDFELRWFTPTKEVDLCGHATLATAHVLFQHLGFAEDIIRFQTRSGELRVSKAEQGMIMDFPALEPRPSIALEAVDNALGKKPKALYTGTDYMAVFSNEDEIRSLKPNMAALASLELRAMLVTAPGDDVDFVSRFFAPKAGIPEDPVTGSAHCMLTPFWAQMLGKSQLTARQVSARSGDLLCELKDDRVFISGEAVTFMEGFIYF